MTDKDPAREAAEEFLGPYSEADEWMNERRDELAAIIRRRLAEALEDQELKVAEIVRTACADLCKKVWVDDAETLEEINRRAKGCTEYKKAILALDLRAAIDSARSDEGRGRDG